MQYAIHRVMGSARDESARLLVLDSFRKGIGQSGNAMKSSCRVYYIHDTFISLQKLRLDPNDNEVMQRQTKYKPFQVAIKPNQCG